MVRFAYHDYADPDARKELPLPATAFLRRFLLHVVPKGFMRIRHSGITANRRRKEALARCRELLGQSQPAPDTAAPPTRPIGVDGADSDTNRCPACGGLMRVIEIIAPTPLRHDTS